MRCPMCGGYSFDSDERCLTPNCGYIVRIDMRPPSWWDSKDWAKPPKSQPMVRRGQQINKYQPKLNVCPHCNKQSRFYNDQDGTYECLNLNCKAHRKSVSDPSSLKTRKIQSRYCPGCSADILVGWRFCASCGQKLT
jgi:hypothetical protein